MKKLPSLLVAFLLLTFCAMAEAQSQFHKSQPGLKDKESSSQKSQPGKRTDDGQASHKSQPGRPEKDSDASKKQKHTVIVLEKDLPSDFVVRPSDKFVEIDEDLSSAIDNHQTSRALKIIQSPSFDAEKNGPALLAAADEVLPSVVQALIDAEVNILQHGSSAVFVIASSTETDPDIIGKQLDILDKLFAAGALTSYKNSDGMTTLSMAARSPNKRILERILQEQPKIDLLDDDDSNAFFLVDNVENAKLLLQAGLKLDQTNKSGENALMAQLGLSVDNSDLINFLLDQAPSLAKGIDHDKRTVLMYAAKARPISPDVMNRLIKSADPNAKDKFGRTALMYLASKGDIDKEVYPGIEEAAKALIKVSDETIPDNDRKTVLMYDAFGGVTKILDSMNKLTPQLITHKDRSGRTALMVAAENQDLEVVEQLLAAMEALQIKEAVDAQDNEGNTALIWALKQEYYIYSNHFDIPDPMYEESGWPIEEETRAAIVGALLAAQADKTIPNHEGWTPLTFAQDRGYSECERLLR